MMFDSLNGIMIQRLNTFQEQSDPIYITNDGWKTWENFFQDIAFFSPNRLLFLNDSTYFTFSNKNLFRTTNSGRTCGPLLKPDWQYPIIYNAII